MKSVLSSLEFFSQYFWVWLLQDSDEEAETSDQDMVEADSSIGKPLTTAIIDSWCRLIVEVRNLSVLPNLLNAYRASCQYGSGDAIDAISQRIQSSKIFVKIVNFSLCEADNIFRTHLEIPGLTARSILFWGWRKLKNGKTQSLWFSLIWVVQLSFSTTLLTLRYLHSL